MPREDWFENTVPKLAANMGYDLSGVNTVLDVACGLSLKSQHVDAQIRVGVDIYEPYLKAIDFKGPYVAIKHDVRKLEELFMPESFDLVMAVDIIEHLHYDDGLKLLRACKRLSKRFVFFETPLGPVAQNMDIQGYGGHEWQTHRSAWFTKDFEERGFTVTTRPYTMCDVQRHTEKDVDPNIILLDAIYDKRKDSSHG